MNIKFITSKTQSKFLLIYMGIAILYLNYNIALLPYKYIQPESALAIASCWMIGVFIFVFIAMLAIGLFVIDSTENLFKEEHYSESSKK